MMTLQEAINFVDAMITYENQYKLTSAWKIIKDKLSQNMVVCDNCENEVELITTEQICPICKCNI